jgi:hypothetical protein
MSTELSDDLRLQLSQNKGVAHALVAYLTASETLARTKAAESAVDAMKTGESSASRQGLHQLGAADSLKALRETIKTMAKLTNN